MPDQAVLVTISSHTVAFRPHPILTQSLKSHLLRPRSFAGVGAMSEGEVVNPQLSGRSLQRNIFGGPGRGREGGEPPPILSRYTAPSLIDQELIFLLN